MRIFVPRLSRFCSKILEIGGAGLASAIGAFLLSQIVTKPAPDLPEARLVQPALGETEVIRVVRTEQAALLAEIRKISEPQAAPDPAAPAAPAKTAAAAPQKPVKPTPPRREAKQETARPVTAAYKAVVEEPVAIQPANVAANTPAKPASPPVVENADLRAAPPEASSGGRFRVLSALRQVPGWFLPDTDKLFSDAPRPPMPVGQFLSRAM
jgi:hypothetical protein